MWTTRALLGWLTTLGVGPGLAVNLPMFPGPYYPDLPDRIGVITTTGGVGESMQGIADTPGFQLLIRGSQDATSTADDAETTALTVDRLIRTAPLPALVGGVWLLPVVRSGGRPSPVPQEDDGDRITFTCNYLTTVLEGPP